MASPPEIVRSARTSSSSGISSRTSCRQRSFVMRTTLSSSRGTSCATCHPTTMQSSSPSPGHRQPSTVPSQMRSAQPRATRRQAGRARIPRQLLASRSTRTFASFSVRMPSVSFGSACMSPSMRLRHGRPVSPSCGAAMCSSLLCGRRCAASSAGTARHGRSRCWQRCGGGMHPSRSPTRSLSLSRHEARQQKLHTAARTADVGMALCISRWSTLHHGPRIFQTAGCGRFRTGTHGILTTQNGRMRHIAGGTWRS